MHSSAVQVEHLDLEHLESTVHLEPRDQWEQWEYLDSWDQLEQSDSWDQLEQSDPRERREQRESADVHSASSVGVRVPTPSGGRPRACVPEWTRASPSRVPTSSSTV
jgi:hypothetical protein